ncbi:phosphonopyruvate decarboxylase [Nocardia terpenica]|uniref:Phosphonopyruvate decarboxylase n=1 Tax=Nocardia terpenica TaxID=455432 RepID=A0A164KN40_9NOCA|nr:thiamine pyrophosphate-dependent enzyme [Nocardia terpenica]KZM71554.1 phosphonopyruvate decarboxylase [Nocardia terpenica]MBF6063185.1 phosphonopyruvate decarboxylase [Nocardia terpenica]MBF6105741.1 phosphonopyruvate decarboxylase [Nocardia terpenica]MBF6113675.1 phosphonopyruvate decarboxylase [Nocardia terpenica]MBF6119482.1 phosphonopyruvate decarboxylase [Nocardia terpenica]
MRRIDALRVLAEHTETLPVVVTCAASSRELAAVADRPNHLYLLDSMGLAGSVGTGLALAVADSAVPKVVTVEGDGSLLMNPNVLPTAGFLRPDKLVLVLLDNAVYGATADLPTYADRIDLGRLAEAAGWTVRRAANADDLRTGLAEVLALPGPTLLHVRLAAGNAPNVPKLLADPVVLGRRFQDWLAARIATPAEVRP